jgi:outer membrane receptor protein involved in Fe transport
VRAPNVVELFTPRSIGLGLDFDPCAGTNPIVDETDPFATPANCARTGVSAAQYGHIAESPGSYNVLSGGNPDLRPEAADTWTLGVVVTPPQVRDLNLTLDYYDIRLSGVISVLDPDVVIEQCLETGNPFLCAQIHRAPGTGSLWIGNEGYVSDFFQNAASLATRGIDVDLRYRRSLASAGRNLGVATLRLTGTNLMSLQTVTLPNAPAFDCAGYYGINCDDPVPRWRHTLSLGWETPWTFDLALAWRYTSAVVVAAASPNAALAGPFDQADYRLGARSYFDVSLHWRASRRVDFRLGVNNIFDVDPPVVGSDPRSGVAANANTYTGVYDALGRWVFVGLTARM